LAPQRLGNVLRIRPGNRVLTAGGGVTYNA